MSLILDALNRAEQERSVCQAVPTVQTVQQLDPPPRSFIAWERLALMLPLLLVALYAVWQWAAPEAATGRAMDAGLLPNVVSALAQRPGALPSGVSEQASEVKHGAMNTAVVQAGDSGASTPGGEHNSAEYSGTQSGVQYSGTQNNGTQNNGIQDHSTVADTNARVPQAYGGSEQMSGNMSAVPVTATRAPVSAAEIGRLYDVSVRQDAVSDQRGIVSGARLDEQIARAQRVVTGGIHAPAQGAAAQVPYITDLPLPLRRAIPTLNYSEHMPAAQAGAGRVRLNGQLLAEGHQVASELELVTIDEQGIIMRFRGVAFRLPALNRWVNF